jgi:hypothetical protein
MPEGILHAFASRAPVRSKGKPSSHTKIRHKKAPTLRGESETSIEKNHSRQWDSLNLNPVLLAIFNTEHRKRKLKEHMLCYPTCQCRGRSGRSGRRSELSAGFAVPSGCTGKRVYLVWSFRMSYQSLVLCPPTLRPPSFLPAFFLLRPTPTCLVSYATHPFK